jgi:hypothetical protein
MPVEEMFRKSLKEHKESRNALHDLVRKAKPDDLKLPHFAEAVEEHRRQTECTLEYLILAAKKAKNQKVVKALVDHFKERSEMQADMCDRFIKDPAGFQLMNPIREKVEESETLAKHKRALLKGDPGEYFSVRFKDSDRLLEDIEKELHNNLGTPDKKKAERHNPRASC